MTRIVQECTGYLPRAVTMQLNEATNAHVHKLEILSRRRRPSRYDA